MYFQLVNSIYQSKQMKNIHPFFRVPLILLGEKLKPASTFGGEEGTEEILKELGMNYVFIKTPDGHLVFDATYDKEKYEQFNSLRNFEEHEIKTNDNNKMESKEWQKTCDHEYFGKIYGYPKCCIDAYSEYMKTGKSSKKLVKRGDIPEELYCIEHNPCSVECKESIEMGRKFKETLEKIDPEALQTLISFNKNGSL